jgi:hypothetical protein
MINSTMTVAQWSTDTVPNLPSTGGLRGLNSGIIRSRENTNQIKFVPNISPPQTIELSARDEQTQDCRLSGTCGDSPLSR